MTINDSGNIWQLELPEEFAAPPKRMSVSALREIETCPRRYALQRARYPEVWNGYGYPQNPPLKVLQGTLVHESLECITKALKQAGCPSISDELFVKTMRKLNGYPGIIDNQLTQLTEKIIANPRLQTKAEYLIGKLKDAVPVLREQLQTQIFKLTFDDRTKPKAFSSSDAQTHHALSIGVHSEVEITAPEIEWYGKVDHLRLLSDGCELTDFKTGKKKDEHIFQIKVYNLLWLLDAKRNPNSIPVISLRLSYLNEDVEVPPLEGVAADDFMDEVKQRTAAAKKGLFDPIPEAKPSISNCDYCSVRQLCSAFWTQEVQEILESEREHAPSEKKRGVDIEVELEGSLAHHIWKAKSLICGRVEPGVQVTIRFASANGSAAIKLMPGMQLRLLDVNFLKPVDEESDALTITTNMQSETFIKTDKKPSG